MSELESQQRPSAQGGMASRPDAGPTQPVPGFAASCAGLFAPGGPFCHSDQPVVLWSDGQLLAANGAASLLAQALAEPAPPLREALLSASNGRKQSLEALPIGGTSAKPMQYLDIDLLPAGDAVLIQGHDVTLQTALRQALVESRQRQKELIALACDFAWETDANGKFSFISTDSALGRSQSSLMGLDPAKVLLAPDQAVLFNTEAPPEGTTLWAHDANGQSVYLYLCGRKYLDAEGRFCGARGICRDITDELEREAIIASARHRERALVHLLRILRQTPDQKDALIRGLKTAVQAVGASGAAIYRLDGENNWSRLYAIANGVDLRPILSGIADGASPVQKTIDDRHVLGFGARYQGLVNGALILWRPANRDDWDADDLFLLSEFGELLAVAIAQVARQEELARLSETDPLTGLLNRRGFDHGLRSALVQARKFGHGGALFYVDLDNFKDINDRHGHAQGDEALRAAANLMRDHLRSRDVLARLGGDEFAFWLDEVGIEGAQRKGAELSVAAEGLQQFSPGSLKRIGFSIGIAIMHPGSALTDAELIENADRAMYQVKQSGKSGVAVIEG